jgi:secreted trypsin-like serine protease
LPALPLITIGDKKMRLLKISVFSLSVCLLLMQTSYSATPRIIGGERAKSGDSPWMAALISRGYSPFYGQFCAGSLIHPSWVLTAAHCTEGQTAHNIEVLLGETTLTSVRTGEIIGVKQIIRHPDYEYGLDNPGWDIALLQLEKPSTQPVLRVAERYSGLTTDGTFATVMGWGATGNSGTNPTFPESLQQAAVPIVSNEQCNAPSSYNGDVKDTMLCAGFADGGTDACVGDSGGPLVVETDTGWQQVGIISWGVGCALPKFYGVYTRLPLFQDFIVEHVCEDIPSKPHTIVNIEGQNATASWSNVAGADGYQFYYAPYSNPLSNVTLDNIYSFDMTQSTQLSADLNKGARFYVAVRAYQGNCYSDYSNLGDVIIP